MDEQLIVDIKKQFDERSHIAHGFDHVERVANLARHIAKREGYDPDIAGMAGYLHDIGRTMQDEEKDHGPAGVAPAKILLDQHTNLSEDIKQDVLNAIRDHSLLETDGMLTHIIQDADMLDGMGAIGIMRAYTSKASLPCYYSANIVPTEGKRGTTIHEQIAFQMEWADFMHTDTGRQIAKTRHQTMLDFLEIFKCEVDGLDLPSK